MSAHLPPVVRISCEERTERKATLEQAAKDRPISNWNLRPVNRLLAGYGRGEYPLGGQMALNSKIDDESRCNECKYQQWECRWVKRNIYWNRNQCVRCAERKTACSRDGSNTKGKSLGA